MSAAFGLFIVVCSPLTFGEKDGYFLFLQLMSGLVQSVFGLVSLYIFCRSKQFIILGDPSASHEPLQYENVGDDSEEGDRLLSYVDHN